MGWLSKFKSLRLIPFLFGGACAAPKLRLASPQDLWLSNFNTHPMLSWGLHIDASWFWESKWVFFQNTDQKWSSVQKMIVSTCIFTFFSLEENLLEKFWKENFVNRSKFSLIRPYFMKSVGMPQFWLSKVFTRSDIKH